MSAEGSWDKCDDTVVTTSSATTLPRRNTSRVSEIFAGKKPYSSLDEFYLRTGIYMLSWYANNLAILIRNVRERVRNGENWPAEYILSRMPVVRILPMHAAAPFPNRVHGLLVHDVARAQRFWCQNGAVMSRVSAIMAGKKPHCSLDEFYLSTDFYMLSWYANNLAILIRDVREVVRSSENWLAEYILSRMLRILPAQAAAPGPNSVHDLPVQDVARFRRVW
jgi:hypothetical protein